MARTYREIAIADMVLTVEEAMSRVLDWWGDLPPSMKEAIEQFRTELGAALLGSIPGAKNAFARESRTNRSTSGAASRRTVPLVSSSAAS
jgi:hypothetical protein